MSLTLHKLRRRTPPLPSLPLKAKLFFLGWIGLPEQHPCMQKCRGKGKQGLDVKGQAGGERGGSRT